MAGEIEQLGLLKVAEIYGLLGIDTITNFPSRVAQMFGQTRRLSTIERAKLLGLDLEEERSFFGIMKNPGMMIWSTERVENRMKRMTYAISQTGELILRVDALTENNRFGSAEVPTLEQMAKFVCVAEHLAPRSLYTIALGQEVRNRVVQEEKRIRTIKNSL